MGDVDFTSFLTFLESGELPTVTAAAEPKTPAAQAPIEESTFGAAAKEEWLKPPPGPPLHGFSALQPSGSNSTHVVTMDHSLGPSLLDAGRTSRGSSRLYVSFDGIFDSRQCFHRLCLGALASDSDALYPSVMKCLGFIPRTTCRDLWHNPGTTLAHTARNSYKKAGPSRPLWRKRETTVHEHIVQYTTVDADGVVQELIETEKTQNEVIHLECKDTGEFAHRESSQYEQVETFNSEIVAAERGNEEYLHLKSKDDEYEHLESNMPKTKMQQRAEEEAAAAAMAEAEAQAAAAAAGLGEEGHFEGQFEGQPWLPEQQEGDGPQPPCMGSPGAQEHGEGFGGGWWSAQRAEPEPRGMETDSEKEAEDLPNPEPYMASPMSGSPPDEKPESA